VRIILILFFNPSAVIGGEPETASSDDEHGGGPDKLRRDWEFLLGRHVNAEIEEGSLRSSHLGPVPDKRSAL
jgi:hypothetical protein